MSVSAGAFFHVRIPGKTDAVPDAKLYTQVIHAAVRTSHFYHETCSAGSFKYSPSCSGLGERKRRNRFLQPDTFDVTFVYYMMRKCQSV
jgi:hypothetical protein